MGSVPLAEEQPCEWQKQRGMKESDSEFSASRKTNCCFGENVRDYNAAAFEFKFFI
jgi:hypothetical protein